jgi:nitrogen fixation/metabolism regulation signal transduction histidine kinase
LGDKVNWENLVIEAGMVILMIVSLLGILIRILRRDQTEGTRSNALTTRSIQFLGLALLVPTVLILGLEKVIAGETVATLVGGIAGYLLSGISES